jgi:hypothetical protein
MFRGVLRLGRVPQVAAAAGLMTIVGLAAGPAGAAVPGGHAVLAGWTATQAPVPLSAGPDPRITINSIACPSKRACVAVGGYDHKSSSHPLAPVEGLLLKMSGTTWTARQAPLPAGAASTTGGQDVVLTAVACPSTTTCVAVGWYVDTTGSENGLLLARSGSTWTATEAPLPAGARAVAQDVQLTGLACPSVTSCVAVGSYVTSTDAIQGVVLAGAGTSWTPVKAAKADSFLNTVACTSATSCVALGGYGNEHGLVLSGAGTSWTAAQAPLPTGATVLYPGFTSVACPAVGSCVAAGGYGDSAGNNHGMLLSGSGTSWTAKTTPLPAGAESAGQFAGLNAVACASTAACTAVGGYLDSSGNTQGMLLAGSGTSWTATEAPLPGDASSSNPFSGISAVACPASASCIAVGQYQNSAAVSLGLLLTGSGTTWTATEAPLPAGASATIPGASVNSVACPAATDCMAGGSYVDSSGNGQGLLLNGPA